MVVVFLVGNVPKRRSFLSIPLILAAREFNSKAAKAIWDLDGKPVSPIESHDDSMLNKD